MEEWIICNKCYRSWNGSRRAFSLTQCQHIFCERCIIGVNERCPECKTIDVSTITLQKPLQEFLMPYFHPLSELMERAVLIANFQRSQELIILRCACKIDDKYDYLKKAYCRAMSTSTAVIAASNRLTENMKELRRRLAAYQSSKTATNPASNEMSNKFAISSSYKNCWEQKRTTQNRITNEAAQSYRFVREIVGTLPNRNLSLQNFPRSCNREQEKAMQCPREHDTSSRRLEHRSNLQIYGRNAPAFTPHQYQYSAILSDDSAESPLTPAHCRKIQTRIPRSLHSSSNLSSSEQGTPQTSNCAPKFRLT